MLRQGQSPYQVNVLLQQEEEEAELLSIEISQCMTMLAAFKLFTVPHFQGLKAVEFFNWSFKCSSMNLRMVKNGIRCPTAAVDTKAEETVMKERMWYVISQNEPSLLPISLASKLLTEDCMACVDLLEVMLVDHLQRNIVQQCEYSNVKATELILPQFVF